MLISSGMETSPSISPAPYQSNRRLRSASFRSTYWSTSRFGRAFVLAECYRILRPGGVVRIGVPDTGIYIQSHFEGGNGLIEIVHPGRPTPLIAKQEIFAGTGTGPCMTSAP
jgi:hypothetical protein